MDRDGEGAGERQRAPAPKSPKSLSQAHDIHTLQLSMGVAIGSPKLLPSSVWSSSWVL